MHNDVVETENELIQKIEFIDYEKERLKTKKLKKYIHYYGNATNQILDFIIEKENGL